MNTRRRLSIGLLSLLAALALVVVGCGDDSGGDTSSSGSASGTKDGGGSETSSEGAGDKAKDAFTNAIEEGLQKLGVTEVRQEDDGPVLVMESGSGPAKVTAACKAAEKLVPDQTVKTEVDGSVEPCP